jgi:hypothetical protein
MAMCPECEFDEIDTEDFEEDDTLSCPECGSSLVFTGLELERADEDDDLADDDSDDDDGDDKEDADE